MSVEVMSAVFKRYPNGGGEMLLALALADRARDDGVLMQIDSVAELARKTRQTDRGVQVQLRRMCDMGWLHVVRMSDGGRGRSSVYRIDREWINGASLRREGAADVASNPEPGSGFDEGNPERASGFKDSETPNQEARNPERGSGAYRPTRPNTEILSPQLPSRGATAPSSKPVEPFSLVGDAKAGPTASAKERKPYPSPVAIETWLADCRAAGVQAIPPDDPVFAYCDSVKLTREILGLHWSEFVRRRRVQAKRQRSWEQTFRNSVEGNWYRLWFITAAGQCEITSLGRQVQAAREAAQQVDA